MLENLAFGTRPLIAHAPGPEVFNPFWGEVLAACLAAPARRIGGSDELTVLTWNDRPDRKGPLEQSLDHLGVPYVVAGAGVRDWVNSRDKPRSTVEALASIDTPYVMGVDSLDAVALGDPARILATYRAQFDADLVFSTEKNSNPNVAEFRAFEESLPGAAESDFHFLNGGAWIGRTEYARAFFGEATTTPACVEDPTSEQGILRRLLMHHHPRVVLDTRCALFQTLLLVHEPILALDGRTLARPRKRSAGA